MSAGAHQGRVVAITGSGQGIGRVLAQRFAREGARVIVSDIDPHACTQTAAELDTVGVPADVTQAEDCARLVEKASTLFGRLDVMVCNAGIMQLKPFLELDGSDWDRMLSVNVKGCFLSLQAAARQMLQQTPLAVGRPQGKIITMASIAGRPGAGPIAQVIPHYRASKAAVISLTQSAAMTFAPKITVNAICPGFFPSKMTYGLLEKMGADKLAQGAPLRRLGDDEDLKGLALLYASDAGKHITGQWMAVDGGVSAIIGG